MNRDIRKELTCDKCHESVEMTKVKYIPKPNSKDFNVMCLDCVDWRNKLDHHEPKETSSKKTKFFCGRCRHKFGFDMRNNNTNLKCPMCGKDDFLNLDKISGSAILKEVSKPGFDELKIGVMRKKF